MAEGDRVSLGGGSFHPDGEPLLFLCLFFLPLCLTSPFSISRSLRGSYVPPFIQHPCSRKVLSRDAGIGISPFSLQGFWLSRSSSPIAQCRHLLSCPSHIFLKCHPVIDQVFLSSLDYSSAMSNLGMILCVQVSPQSGRAASDA